MTTQGIAVLSGLTSVTILVSVCAGQTVSEREGQRVSEIIDSTGDGVSPLHVVRDIAVDGSGNVFVSGQDSSNVFRVAPNGTVTEVIDGTGDGNGNLLLQASQLTIDSSGNVYLSASGFGGINSNVFKITPAGRITEILDDTGDGVSGFIGGYGIDVDDASGDVYVAGSTSDNVFRISAGGGITEIIDSSGDGMGNTFDFPLGLTVDAAGNVYVASVSTDKVFKRTPGGTITVILDSTGDGAGNALDQPEDVAVDASGNVYVTGRRTDNVFRITPTGTVTEVLDSFGDGNGNVLDKPFKVTTDESGNVYVTGLDSRNVFKISANGSITEILDRAGASFALNYPVGIAVGGASKVFVAATGALPDNRAFKVLPPVSPNQGRLSSPAKVRFDTTTADVGTVPVVIVESQGSRAVYVGSPLSGSSLHADVQLQIPEHPSLDGIELFLRGFLFDATACTLTRRNVKLLDRSPDGLVRVLR